jgi:hypothetical protein
MVRVWTNVSKVNVHNETSWPIHMAHSRDMTNTGTRREIKRYANAKESETVEAAKSLVSRAKQRSAKGASEVLERERRNARKPKAPLTDAEASDRMVDEGNPNTKPTSGKV